jgi:hypothetical protein
LSLSRVKKELGEGVTDTMTLSGSEAYSAALIFYSSVKSAAKSRIQKVETIRLILREIILILEDLIATILSPYRNYK